MSVRDGLPPRCAETARQDMMPCLPSWYLWFILLVAGIVAPIFFFLRITLLIVNSGARVRPWAWGCGHGSCCRRGATWKCAFVEYLELNSNQHFPYTRMEGSLWDRMFVNLLLLGRR